MNYDPGHGTVKQHQRLKKGRNREKGHIIWSFNIRSTLDSVISDGGHRLRANGFKLRPLPVAYSNAIPSPPLSHYFIHTTSSLRILDF